MYKKFIWEYYTEIAEQTDLDQMLHFSAMLMGTHSRTRYLVKQETKPYNDPMVSVPC